MTRVLLISDEAWAGLVKQAALANHFPKSKGGHSISDYFIRLVNMNPAPTNWRDTRPADLKEMDLDLLEEGQAPVWDAGGIRKPRRVADWAPDVSYLARALTITRGYQAMGRGDFLHPGSLTSMFWEAFGLGHIQPDYIPEPLSFRYTPRALKGRKDKELDW